MIPLKLQTYGERVVCLENMSKRLLNVEMYKSFLFNGIL